MKKIKHVAFLLILSLFLAGCNLPGSTEPTVDIVATQVARMLTEGATEEVKAPTETVAPTLTETETPVDATPTQTATVTVTPTLTPDQSDPAQQLGSAAWTQDFSGSSSAWDFDYEQATFATANGYLNMTAKANANWHSWYVSSPKLKNAYVEATIQMSNCSGLDRFGLAVRASSDGQQFYYLGITCDGQWGFYRMAPDVEISEIRGYQVAVPLSDGTNNPHRVGIWMKGSTFTFYIDGEEVGTATDATLTNEGYTGFLIAFSNNSGFTVRVDELKHWNVP
jgi:hypothetical protein